MALARGLRNNNPGNIKWNEANKWQGQVGKDDRGFVIFDTPENGIRALGIVALNYHLKHGINTLRAFGDRWAPPGNVPGSDNPEALPGQYGIDLAKRLGVHPDEVFDFKGRLADLVQAIAKNENSIIHWSSETYLTGANLSLQAKGLA